MKRFKFIILALMFTAVCSAEQSVYTNSDFIDSGTLAKKNDRDILILKQEISQLKEKVEGLNTIIQGQNSEIANLKQKSNNNLEDIVNQISQRVAVLENKIEKQSHNIVPVANRSMPKKSTLESVPESTPEITTAPKVKKTPSLVNIPSRKLFKKSVLNFTKKRYTKAQEGFKELLKRKYKKASTNFYLGEISYKRGRYKDAISYYQQSATIDENANYMDRLLLHTAIALKKKGKSSEAKTFFQAVVEQYPTSTSAKDAKRYLTQIKH